MIRDMQAHDVRFLIQIVLLTQQQNMIWRSTINLFSHIVTMLQRKRKVFSAKEKVNVIWRLENGETNRNIANECGVPHSTISIIWKNKDTIKPLFESNSLVIKRSRSFEHKVMEEAL